MKHEFKQGDEVEFRISLVLPDTEWKKGTYVGFYAENHIVGFENDSLYWIDKDENIRPIKKRWRAGIGKPYFYVLSQGDYVDSVERNDSVDDERYNIGNYFRTGKQAEQAAELIKQTLKNFHDKEGFVDKLKDFLKIWEKILEE